MRTDTQSRELRKEFVEQLHVLFDILDTSRTGRISYETLCARFTEVHKPHLPPSFLRCVGKVASADGYLTFDRFLTAVKLSLRDSEINNNIPLHRVQSEGRIDNLTAERRKMHNDPSMGINDFYRRSQLHYGSQPNITPEPIPQPRVIPIHTSTTSISRPPSYSNYMHLNFENTTKPPNIILRPKKTTVRSQKEESRMRHPLPPNGNAPPRVQVIRSRPHSTTSYNSIASSGLENISWRNSSLSSSTDNSGKRNTVHEDDVAPRVAKLDGLHKEEEELLRKGMEMSNRLQEWYKERMETVEKRSRLLNQGMVALESAVHEQKLNFLRAHLTELNRRMVALMETSDKGFPTHENLQKSNLPQPQDDQLTWLHRQNKLLNQELGDKVRQIEDLKREKENFDRSFNVNRIQPSRPTSTQPRPSAYVRPAFQQPTPQAPRSNPSPIKIYDTLM